MTPEQKLKHMILSLVAKWRDLPMPEFSADTIDAAYVEADEGEYEDDMQDARNEVRSSGIDTSLPCEYSRHYESKAVAAQAMDGSWVGWTYWYGGGKHGEPQAVEWMSDAYDVACTEEQKMVTVRTFVATVNP